MKNILLAIPIALSFLIAFFLIPIWIRKAKQIGLMWNDMNKINAKKVAGSGGIAVVFGFIIGSFIYIAYRVFYLQTQTLLIEIFALTTSIFFLASIGLIDDLLGWQRGGLSRRSRIILVALSAIPLIAINAGKSEISLPFLGIVNLGIIYPLILIPFGIVGATTTFNFLAGMNGLEAGQGILLLSALAITSYATQNSWLAIIALCMIASLFAFLYYNRFPAKIFPGDVLTYAVGGLIAIMAIMGNFEKIAVFFFIPYIIETFLKLRGKLIKQSFGKPHRDNSLSLLHDKIYGLTHLSIYILQKLNIKPTEKRVVYLIWIFQAIIISLGFIIFGNGIFPQ